MGLDDKDKKFIKDTIETSVSKNVDSQMKKTNTELKRESLSRSIEERKQRDKYIEELKKLQDDGQATMAQKFELFREEMKQTIPDDFKNTWKDVSNTVGKGANKIGSGLDKAASRLMNLNPVTAMLWNNKDILGDIIGGTAQLGWGAVKGIAGGAAGLLNNATNAVVSKFKKKKEDEEETTEEKPKEKLPKLVGEQQPEQNDFELEIPMLGSEGESNAERMAKLSEEMEQKINEIHEVVLKEQKGQAKTLSEGLSGMQKTMDAIKQVTDMMKAKQILIATGVILGAAAIIGLAAWFKSGGFQRMIQGVGQNILKGLASEGGQAAREKADQYVQDQLNQINTDAADFDNMNKSMGLTGGQDFSKTTYMTDKNNPYTGTQLQALDLQKSLQKEGFSEDRARQLVNGAWYGTSAAKFQNVNKAKPWVLKLPFKTYIPGNGIHKIKGDDTHVDFDLCRKVGKVTKMVTFTNGITN